MTCKQKSLLFELSILICTPMSPYRVIGKETEGMPIFILKCEKWGPVVYIIDLNKTDVDIIEMGLIQR